METLTPMALALCAALKMTDCSSAGEIFYRNAIAPDLRYDRAVICSEECDLDEDHLVCVQISSRSLPSGYADKIYFCRPRDNEGEGADS